MPSILTQNYHTHLATDFRAHLALSETIDTLYGTSAITANAYTSLLEAANAVVAYVFVGYPSPWPVDVDPPTPEESPQITGYDYWRHMLGAKRVAAANTNHVIPRVNWTTGTVYTQYDDTVDLTGEQFYVLVLDGGTTYQVYKCLWNNGGGESTEEPTGTDLEGQTYADGYVWKYLYSLPTVNDKFLTPEWMPVYANTAIQAAAELAPGTLPVEVPLVIEYEGLRYNSSANVQAILDGDGTGATVANAGVTVIGGTIASIVLQSGGEGYSNVASINVYQSGNVVQATARAIIPPYPGHGHDPIHELQAKHLMCVIQLSDDEAGKLTIENNFRQIGILINPLLANGAVANDTFYKQTWDVTVGTGAPIYDLDDVVINTGKTPSPSGVVVDVLNQAGDPLIRLVNVNTRGLTTPFSYDDVLQVDGGSPSTVTADAVVGPELLPYSGQILYANQRIPVTRGDDETQDIKIVLPFG